MVKNHCTMRKTILLSLIVLTCVQGVMGCCGPKQPAGKPVDMHVAPFIPAGAVADNCGVVNRMDTTQKTVYLVFTAHYSRNDKGAFENFDGIVPVLDVLKEKGVKGSFFPTGECFRVRKYRKPLKRIIREGHYLSAHSNKHLLLCQEDDTTVNLVTADSLARDIAGMEAELNKLGLNKKDYSWMIPPYEKYNQFSASVLRGLGYKLVNPTPGILTGEDWAPEGAPNFISGKEIMDSIWEFGEKHSFNGVILLVHAMRYPDRKDADRIYTRLGEIIDGLKDKGYAFGTFKDPIR